MIAKSGIPVTCPVCDLHFVLDTEDRMARWVYRGSTLDRTLGRRVSSKANFARDLILWTWSCPQLGFEAHDVTYATSLLESPDRDEQIRVLVSMYREFT